MPYQATIYRVFIASPSDVPKERGIIRNTVIDWNSAHAFSRKLFLDPIGWETHSTPALGDRPQALINKQILKDSDLLIGVFWTRLGTATGDHASGTVEEIEEHLAAGKPAMIYFSEVPVRPDSVDSKQYEALRAFRKDLEKRGLIDSYSDQSEFAQKLNRHLNQTMNTTFRGETPSSESTILASQASSPRDSLSLSDDALELLSEAVSGDGVIIRLRHLNGLLIQVNNNVIDTSTPRLSARWSSAVDELIGDSFIRDRGNKGEIFDVTQKGYIVIEALGMQ